MRKLTSTFPCIFLVFLFLIGCQTWNKSQKGAVIGTAGGAVAGAVIGKAAGNTVLGAIIGGAVGGVAGAIIGRGMDKQAEEIKNVIPDAKVIRVGEGIQIEFSSKILFAFDESILSTSARTNLDKLIVVLKKYPDTNIEIQGHTDSKGTYAYNLSLSERRALEVAQYLGGIGMTNEEDFISPSRLTIVGFGEKFPKYTNDTEEGRTQNRRVEFLITANEKMKSEAVNEANKTNNR
jgi:outer membrane protein OmpA-like peptidoglycan-associated protein